MGLRTFIRSLPSRPFLLFFPFIFIYVLVLVLFYDKSECLTVDGVGYLLKSSNLLKGFYSPADPWKITMEQGPGYPVFLLPFTALKTPHVVLCLINALLHYLAVVFLYKALRVFNCRTSLCVAAGMFLACYYPAFMFFKYVCRESLTVFLCSLLLYASARAFSRRTLRSIVAAGFVLGFLVLTKVMFAYVLLVISAVFAVLFVFFRRARADAGFFLRVIGFAWLFISPYLLYTYSLTKNHFYFSTSGGEVLYSMSTLHPMEYGDYLVICDTNYLDYDLKRRQNIMYSHHKEDIDYFSTLNILERDRAYKERAVRNILKNPLKYAKNCVANFSRMWIETPDSYFPQQYKVVIYLPVHSFLLVFFVLSMVVLLMNFRSLSLHTVFVMLLAVVYVGGSTLVSAYIRVLFAAVPFMLFLTAIAFQQFISLRVAVHVSGKKPAQSFPV